MLAEEQRLHEAHSRTANWQRWGPYLSERQWGTVREDYSADGEPWEYFPHDHARSRAYRWGEDGLLGITDRECRLCFALALWNGRDPILKERFFGLTGHEGNHGEDVKECYYYLDSTPTHSYLKALYKYPQAEFPYDALVHTVKRDAKHEPEFELTDTGVFDGDRYFDVLVEYAKNAPDDICIRITAANRGPEKAALHLLPTFWFRNTWSWGCKHEGCWMKPRITQTGEGTCSAHHVTLGKLAFQAGPRPDGAYPPLLFTENETNTERLNQTPNRLPFVRDAFHDYIVHGTIGAVNPKKTGTKAAAHYQLEIAPGAEISVSLRLYQEDAAPADAFGVGFAQVFVDRIREADEFYAARTPAGATGAERHVIRQAYAGLLWNKQFYHYIVQDWLEGDPAMPPPPESHKHKRNTGWPHLFNRDVISMPDSWEYPWYAAWDLAFHMIAFAAIDPEFAKSQLLLVLREWYMHPNGQIPAYEFALGDANPPVHAWVCWRVYKMTGPKGARDTVFLARAFLKLMLNFTWWVNRKDPGGNNIFAGGFLGLDNIGVFDRSNPPSNGASLQQADGTAWMAFYSATMLAMALELARDNPEYEDVASKFFEHFIAITDAMNTLGGTGLWNEEDGFYYDQIKLPDASIPLRIRSIVGVIPLFAVEVLDKEVIESLDGFKTRLNWFLDNRSELAASISYLDRCAPREGAHTRRLLAIPSRERLERVLRYVLDENEFLAPHGVRSLSRVHLARPFVFRWDSKEAQVDYEPGNSSTDLFGGNSNWRGPVWSPLNYLLIEALERYHYFYGDTLRLEFPTGSGNLLNLGEIAHELAARISRLFVPDDQGRRPCFGADARYARDPHWRDLILFHEYFHGDDGRGLGASHQTGWTALVVRTLEQAIAARQVRSPQS